MISIHFSHKNSTNPYFPLPSKFEIWKPMKDGKALLISILYVGIRKHMRLLWTVQTTSNITSHAGWKTINSQLFLVRSLQNNGVSMRHSMVGRQSTVNCFWSDPSKTMGFRWDIPCDWNSCHILEKMGRAPKDLGANIYEPNF
jgi:hypothetical protein